MKKTVCASLILVVLMMTSLTAGAAEQLMPIELDVYGVDIVTAPLTTVDIRCDVTVVIDGENGTVISASGFDFYKFGYASPTYQGFTLRDYSYTLNSPERGHLTVNFEGIVEDGYDLSGTMSQEVEGTIVIDVLRFYGG